MPTVPAGARRAAPSSLRDRSRPPHPGAAPPHRRTGHNHPAARKHSVVPRLPGPSHHDRRHPRRRRRSGTGQLDHPGRSRQLHRHRHRVLRFLRLCHCRRPGDRSGILPADIRHRADAQRLPHLRHRLPRPSAGLGAVRPLRRPHRAQVDPGRLAAADGGVHHPDRRPPRLRQHRLLGAVAALRAALRPGPRPRRRVGRRRAAGHGERAGRQARLVRHVSPARPVDRLPRRQRPVPGPGDAAQRGAVP